MHITLFDLGQLTPQRVAELGESALRHLVLQLLDDLRETHDRLNQTPQNSSRPPGSMPPWDKAKAGKAIEGEEDELGKKDIAAEDKANTEDALEVVAETAQETPVAESANPDKPAKEKKNPGHQTGTPGHGRTQDLPVTAEERHLPCNCVVCDSDLPSENFVPRFGHYSLDVVPGTEQAPGLGVTNTKHIYGDITCTACGHCNRSEPGRAVPEASDKEIWEGLELSEWRLVGTYLACLIVFMHFRARCSYTIIQEFLRVWMGISLSTATLNHAVHEMGFAVESVVSQLAEDVVRSALLHADETSWPESGKMRWLWVFVNASTCLYAIGSRGIEVLDRVLGGFLGRLMSDGYGAYRHFKNRLRCWAHLLRKAVGLAESTDPRAKAFGKAARDLMEQLMDAIFKARESPPAVSLTIIWAAALQAFRKLCEEYAQSDHAKTAALAREFLNDWDVIWSVLADPSLPLTNNLAERALRHWVIARRISYGTRTPRGTRAFALLASVIDTCRLRGADPWRYLASLLEHRRQGKAPPALPPIPSLT